MRTAYELTRPQKLYVICAAIFITALVIAEATASKFFTAFELPFTLHLFGQSFTSVTMTAGVLAFPVTFIVTDVLNEYYGKKGIRFVTYVGMAMIVFEFGLLQLAMAVPEATTSPVPDAAFDTVFGASGRIIVGSLTAYLLGQLADITLFHWLRGLTEGKYLWLRATGSTFGSQFIDTLIVLSVAFAGQLTVQEILAITLFNYSYKFVIAIGITPIIYAAHWAMDRYLGHAQAEQLREQAEQPSTA
ncbi:queuosine precursor transporter [Salisaeta longa]|uniref:queuosine precursor transporter n=1 Tax=Salisaeta longa TaxID=503170 RepID=UPI0003B47D51|nr:queuosine precursor transporter [Salisaeta longa]